VSGYCDECGWTLCICKLLPPEPARDSYYVDIARDVLVVGCPVCGVHHVVFDDPITIGALSAIADTHRCSGPA
jgi:hypothetical protein